MFLTKKMSILHDYRLKGQDVIFSYNPVVGENYQYNEEDFSNHGLISNSYYAFIQNTS